ncbi:MAG: helix-turn-helix domain-containing protein [Vulcanibacillus sp.]
MTLGEKIKYYRSKIGLTQKQLAEASGIHLVSIKKYETDKMQPQLPQIEKIAIALNVGVNAFVDINNFNLSCKTVGDLMGIMLMLCNSNILVIDGVRNENDELIPDSISVKFNDSSIFNNAFRMYLTKEITEDTEFKPHMLQLEIKNQFILKKIVIWEKINYLYQNALNTLNNNLEHLINENILKLEKMKKKIELELQNSMILLDNED